MSQTFELQITNQHWLGEPSGQLHDGCSHGGIRAVIGETLVTSSDSEYGISQSALSLLRTLEDDHSPAQPISAGYLLCHGCGYPTNFGCGDFGTDWIVRHEADIVLITQPTHYDAAGTTEFDAQARVSIDDYRGQVIAFAEEVCDFFAASQPRQVEKWEQELDQQFWTEFSKRLSRAKSP